MNTSPSENTATNNPRLIWLADISMLSVAAIWGLNMPIMKFALSRVDPYLFNAVRLAVSALTLGLIVWWVKDPVVLRGKEAVSLPSQIKMIIWFGLFSGFLYQVLFLVGIDNTTAGNTALIMSAIPMWTSILAFAMLGERLKRLAWLGLLIALAGTLVVTSNVPLQRLSDQIDNRTPTNSTAVESRGIRSSVWGNLIVSVAAFSWAMGSVISRPMMQQITPIGLAFAGITVSLPLHFLIAIKSWSQIGTFFSDGWLLASLVYSGALSTGLAYALWNFGIRTLGTSHAAIFQNLVPFVALVAAWLLIDESPVSVQIVGGLIIIAGVVVMRQNRT